MCVEGSSIGEGDRLVATELPEDAESCLSWLGRGGNVFSCFSTLSVFAVGFRRALRILVILEAMESITDAQSTSVS